MTSPPHKLRYLYCSTKSPWNAEGWLAVEGDKPAVKFAFRADVGGAWLFCIHENDTLGVLLGEVKGFVRQGAGCITLSHVKKIILDSYVKYSKKNGKMVTQRIRDALNGILDEATTEFIMACDQTKKRFGRPLTLSHTLEVALHLGYRKVAEKGEHKLWLDD